MRLRSTIKYRGLASVAQVLRRLLELHGFDAREVGREAGIDLLQVPTPEQRLDVDKFDAILAAVIPRIPDPAFGLDAARCWHPSNLGVLGHAWLASATLRAGLDCVVRYSRIIGERGATETEDTPEGLKVRFWANRGDPAHDLVAATVIDMAMSTLFDMCRVNAGSTLQPLAVTLRRQRPSETAPYERLFGCPVGFDASENSFVLSRADADRVLQSSNQNLSVIFERLLEGELGRLDTPDVIARCRAAVMAQLHSGGVSGEAVAAQLHMSARTLQRRLGELGTSYQKVVDDVRRDLAAQYMDDERTIADITFSLGFSEASSFSRAFKRWHGKSPTGHRKSVQIC